MKDFILVYSLGRSGGSNLSESIKNLIDKNLGVNYQPFSGIIGEEIGESNNPEKVLREKLSEFYFDEDVRLIKHCITDFPKTIFHYRRELELKMFDWFDKIVFNTRDNFFKRQMSAEIARIVNKWHIESEEDKKKIMKSMSNNIPIRFSKLKLKMDNKKRIMRTMKSYLKNNKIDYCEANYEDIFENNNVDERFEKVQNILDCLNVEYNLDNKKEVKKFLNPKRKFSSKKMYEKISGVEEINKFFGPDYGYLFE